MPRAPTSALPSGRGRSDRSRPRSRCDVARRDGLQLFDGDGQRKYVTADEREALLRAAERAPRQVRTLCLTLDYSGCRLSETIALTADRVDLEAALLVFASLKKRREVVFRAVPVLDALGMVHGVRGCNASAAARSACPPGAPTAEIRAA